MTTHSAPWITLSRSTPSHPTIDTLKCQRCGKTQRLNPPYESVEAMARERARFGERHGRCVGEGGAIMIFGSVCSGIEAASSAWHPLGWRAAWVSEIDPFASAVLSHRYPETTNHGDFTAIGADEGPVDLLVGGTPCQSFSVAGLRGGMADDRGNLALEFLRLAGRLRPRWVVWENVPGVLSSNRGRDFGSFLGGLVELGYGFAYRVLDAQFVRVDGFGRAVPQRRRRVFVVGHLGDWRRPASVLFDRESLSRNPPPGRQTGTDVAGTLDARPTGGGFPGTDGACSGHIVAAECAPAITSHPYGDHESREGLLVAHTLRGDGFDASEDGTGRGTPIVAMFNPQAGGKQTSLGYDPNSRTAGTLVKNQMPAVAYQCHGNNVGPMGTLRKGNGAITGGVPFIPDVAFAVKTQARRIGQGWNDTIVGSPMAVRRLTPRECERLMGFPDDWTLVPYRGKSASDGPRYKAIGNSMAVNVMRWIGRRIEMVERCVGEGGRS